VNGRADEAAMASDEDAGVFIHRSSFCISPRLLDKNRSVQRDDPES
jgi:hypothetical protein